MSDVVHLDYYNKGHIEVWDFITDHKLNFLLGDVIKYVTRAGRKNPATRIEDLQKDKNYIDKQIAVWEAENGTAEQ